MPNILDPSFNIPDIKPTEIGVESTAAAGRRIGVYGSQIAAAQEQTGRTIGRATGDVVDAAYAQAEHMEISKGAAHGAELVATLNESWNQTAKNADPNDPSVAAKWRAETLEPALEQYKSSFLTKGAQQWAEHFVDTYREHTTVKTAADMSSLAADAVHVNAVKTINGLSTAAFNDPSTVSFARDTLAHSLDGLTGSSPTISATDAAKVKGELTLKGEESIVKSAIMGAIVKGGDWQSIANDPKNKPYVNAPEIQQFERAERFYQRAAAGEQRQARVMQDYTAKTDFNRAADDLELSTIPTQPGERPQLPGDYWDKVKKMGAMPGAALEPGRLRTAIDIGEKLTDRLNKADPITVKAVEDHLTAGLFDPVHPTTVSDIIRAQSDLSDASVKRLVQSVKLLQGEELSDPIFKDTMAGARQIVEGTGPEKALNAGKYAAFAQAFLPQYLAQKRAGTLPPNALNMDDPKSMISAAIATATGGPAKTLPAAIGANGGVGAPLPVYTAPKGAPTQQARPPEAGETRQYQGTTYRFKGGDFRDQKNWEPVS